MVSLNVAAIDLFCGIGGLTHGLIKAGIPVVAGIDIDETCKYAYETNNESKFICKDVRELTGADLEKLYPDECIKVLVGVPHANRFPHILGRIEAAPRMKNGVYYIHFLS